MIGDLFGELICWKLIGGMCDGNKLYVYGFFCIDMFGVCGGEIYSFNEYFIFVSIVECVKLIVILFYWFVVNEFFELYWFEFWIL